MSKPDDKYTKEACVEGLTQAINAEKQGANRLELCARLDLDGLTPDENTIMAVKQLCDIPVRVIIRPREGDFIYSDAEFSAMKASILKCRDIGVEGIVIGITTADNKLDIPRISELVQLALPLKVTIHKAIDAVENPLEELEKLLQLEGVSAALTSGKGETWYDGQDLIKKMIEKSRDKIEIIACGKVTNENIDVVHNIFKSKAYHGKLIVGKL
jgi:copper homeostasis protein